MLPDVTVELKKKYMRVFSTDDGQEILEDLKQRGCFYTTTFASTAEDALVGEGRRQMILHIETMLMPFEAEQNTPDGQEESVVKDVLLRG